MNVNMLMPVFRVELTNASYYAGRFVTKIVEIAGLLLIMRNTPYPRALYTPFLNAIRE
jgi:hypothetical protein